VLCKRGYHCNQEEQEFDHLVRLERNLKFEIFLKKRMEGVTWNPPSVVNVHIINFICVASKMSCCHENGVTLLDRLNGFHRKTSCYHLRNLIFQFSFSLKILDIPHSNVLLSAPSEIENHTFGQFPRLSFVIMIICNSFPSILTIFSPTWPATNINNYPVEDEIKAPLFLLRLVKSMPNPATGLALSFKTHPSCKFCNTGSPSLNSVTKAR